MFEIKIKVWINTGRRYSIRYGARFMCQQDGYGFSILLPDGKKMMIKKDEFERV